MEMHLLDTLLSLRSRKAIYFENSKWDPCHKHLYFQKPTPSTTKDTVYKIGDDSKKGGRLFVLQGFKKKK